MIIKRQILRRMKGKSSVGDACALRACEVPTAQQEQPRKTLMLRKGRGMDSLTCLPSFILLAHQEGETDHACPKEATQLRQDHRTTVDDMSR